VLVDTLGCPDAIVLSLELLCLPIGVDKALVTEDVAVVDVGQHGFCGQPLISVGGDQFVDDRHPILRVQRHQLVAKVVQLRLAQ
jgi:DNA-binding cell septation regulator SpoVG